ncbi:MAG: SdpI family protein [Brevundimonas sp.]|uniref:SdpI family protein n=1 Tax=Brevundimonas sp. TaxID=1871086 RepID=UPI002721024D|nr:SdpI family protein [Brevundimonas sp.]MDZ4317963.1 SdpI family protein [Phenylobacterium sp.]MDO9588396.1 SdpI family protein [Brevundimonas sp.]MDP3370473.1 SdpI family protein [Brevundimonas sp.]MDP3656724.1 SdpI family protein [Brevundimonas sp.]MDZ4110442.1 SdpI family protein [Brevundimonas sp.]
MTAPQKSLSALDLATVGLSLMVGGLGVWTIFAGPTELLPIHWNAAGQVDDWGSRELLGGALVGLALLNLLLGGGMALAAGRADDPARRRALRYAQLVVVLTVPLISLLIASASLSGATDIGGALPIALMSFVILLMGAFLGRVGSNPFVGVRTPWAFKSRLAWERSNRLAGRLFFVIGLAGLLTAPFAPQPIGLYVLLAAIGVAAVWSVVESWRVWRTDPDRQPF